MVMIPTGSSSMVAAMLISFRPSLAISTCNGGSVNILPLDGSNYTTFFFVKGAFNTSLFRDQFSGVLVHCRLRIERFQVAQAS